MIEVDWLGVCVRRTRTTKRCSPGSRVRPGALGVDDKDAQEGRPLAVPSFEKREEAQWEKR